MMVSAMEKNKIGRGLCARDIFTGKVTSELSYRRGYLGEECGWMRTSKCKVLRCVQGWIQGE